MRVLHICQRDDPATGGAARVAVELVRRLPDCGVDAQCVFVYGGRGALSAGIEGQTHWLGVNSSRQAAIGILRLVQLIKRLKPDIIHHHDGLIWTHLVTYFQQRAVVIGHGHLDGPQPGASMKKRLSHVVHLKTYKHLVAVSEFTRRAWIATGYSESITTVLPNGVDTKKFYLTDSAQRTEAKLLLGIPAGVKVALSVGRLHVGMKGTDDFIRVVKLLGDGWHGVIAGVGPDELALKGLCQELGIDDRVHFVGLLDPVLVGYHASDSLIVTSHYEPFGLMAVEALACGLPIIGFATRGGVMDILKFAQATVIENRDVNLMAKAILEGTNLQVSESRRKSVIQHYDWLGITRMLVDDVYQKL
ncbi:glycosyltransferase family 4 protein [Algibacter sp.]|nr:glycosyltransferase family 4 protein [Algibacter sp.]